MRTHTHEYLGNGVDQLGELKHIRQFLVALALHLYECVCNKKVKAGGCI